MSRQDSSARHLEIAPQPVASSGPVCSHNEWDPLEEVIVGVVEGACVPPWHSSLEATLPTDQFEFFRKNAGSRFPAERVHLAEQELAELVRTLEGEGVHVVRPSREDFARSFSTPHWQSESGLYAAMPRDFLLVIGDEIIESPMAWRSRYYESAAYRPLLKEYFRRGARWTAAPKPELRDDLYVDDYAAQEVSVITEFEPTFDAADFLRLGRDLIVQRSHVTNHFGIEWLRRHLGDEYRIHVLEFEDDHPMHIDATIMPLAPGKLLINPERVPKVPRLFKGWDVFTAPPPAIPESHTLYMTSRWINMNILMLDHERIIVEATALPMIRAAKSWGLRPIPVAFRNFNSFGGSFHCATSDIRRAGTLESYLTL